jgi:hypothetical protein
MFRKVKFNDPLNDNHRSRVVKTFAQAVAEGCKDGFYLGGSRYENQPPEAWQLLLLLLLFLTTN